MVQGEDSSSRHSPMSSVQGDYSSSSSSTSSSVQEGYCGSRTSPSSMVQGDYLSNRSSPSSLYSKATLAADLLVPWHWETTWATEVLLVTQHRKATLAADPLLDSMALGNYSSNRSSPSYSAQEVYSGSRSSPSSSSPNSSSSWCWDLRPTDVWGLSARGPNGSL